MRRIPLEYGDNFPVPAGIWNPTVPWRFPKHQVQRRSSWGLFLPWVMLGLGLTLGILWMSCREVPFSGGRVSDGNGPGESMVLPMGPSAQPVPGQAAPSAPARPKRLKSQLA